jgi:hypothetical protein
MSKKKVGRKLVTDIIRNVLENREDVELDDISIRELTSSTIRTTPIIDILSTWDLDVESVQENHNKDDARLARCIEVLALVNSIIDQRISGGPSG